MRRMILTVITVIVVMTCSASFAENKYLQIEPFSEDFAAVQNEDELWGYIDNAGELVIPCEWERAGSFTNGIASVRKNHKYGCINKNGEIIIPCEWNGYSPLRFSEGLAPVLNDEGLWGFINMEGAVVIECKWPDVLIPHFSEGLAAVGQNGKMGYINKMGQIVIPCQYQSAGSFSHGYARVRDDEGLFFINTKGEEAFPEFPRATCIDSFREDGIAYIEFKNSTGVFINTEGKTVCMLPDGIKYRSNFREGLAGVAKMNKHGEYVGCEGFIDRSGKTVIPLELYSSYYHFINGVTSVPDRRITASDKQIRYGVIDHAGNFVYPFLLEKAVVFTEKVAEGIQDGFAGAINTDGDVIVPFEYDSVRVGDGFILCLKEGRISIFDYTGKMLK